MDYWRSSRVVAQGRHDQRVPVLQHHPRRPAPALHGAAGQHPAARHPARRAAVPVARRGGCRSSPWRAVVPFALVTFVLGAMVAISNWELPMGVLVVALLAGRWQPLSPLFSRARLQLGAAADRRADRRLRPVHALLPRLRRRRWCSPARRAVHRLGLLHHRADVAAPSSSPCSALLLFPPAVLFSRLCARCEPLVARGGRRRGAPPRHRGGRAWPSSSPLMAGNAVLPLLALLLGAALAGCLLGQRRRGARRLSAHRRRHRGAARLRGRVPQGLVRREALPHEHRLQALLPGLDDPGHRGAVGARAPARAALAAGRRRRA